jgi:acyl-CoA synthetase (NDP forming)
VVVKGGMAGGAAATMSHTASLAGSFEAFRAACQQAGVYLIEGLTEDPKMIVNVLSMLSTQRPALGNRIGVVSVGGGAGILLADQITTHGMQLAEFTPESRTALGRLFQSKARGATEKEQAGASVRVVTNPLDLIGDANDDRLIEAVRLLERDENTDIIMVGLYLQVPHLSEYIAERLVDLSNEVSKPFIISPRGYSPYVFDTRAYLSQNGVPTYTVPMIEPLSIAVQIWKRYRTDFSR